MVAKPDLALNPYFIVRKRGETDGRFIKRLKAALITCRVERDDAEARLRYALRVWNADASGRAASRRAKELENGEAEKWGA